MAFSTLGKFSSHPQQDCPGSLLNMGFTANGKNFTRCLIRHHSTSKLSTVDGHEIAMLLDCSDRGHNNRTLLSAFAFLRPRVTVQVFLVRHASR